MAEKKKVVLGMSGGVDSSVSAILLQKIGYEVIGVTFKLFKNYNSEKAVEDAKKVCDKLNIEHHILDFELEFYNGVIKDFIECYKNAKTPNPCIECNKYIKFKLLFEKAKELNVQYIATGHYAKVEFNDKYNRYVLKKSESKLKDQSYVLCNISKEVLPYVIFPLAEFDSKEEIRKIARENGLEVAEKKDSQEICFIQNNDYVSFLSDNLSSKEKEKCFKQGDIIDIDGKFRAKHNGIVKYTIGQRKGLGIQNLKPLYVIKLDKKKNQVIVGEKEHAYQNVAYVTDLNLLLIDELNDEIEVMAKIRYNSKEAKAKLCKTEKDSIYKVIFEEPQFSITRGQTIAFYIDDIVLGGAKIM